MATLRFITGSTVTTAGDRISAVFTPAADELIVVFVGHSAGAAPGGSTVTGNSLTYSSIGQVTFGANRILEVFTARGANPTSGAVTLDFDAAGATGSGWAIYGITGAHGTTPTPEVVTNTTAGDTTLTVTLASLASDAIALAWFGIELNTALTHETGWTEHIDGGFNNPSSAYQAQSRTDGADASCTASWTGTSAAAAIIVEVASAAAQTISAVGAVGSAETVGSSALRLGCGATGIASAEQLPTSQVLPGAVLVQGAGIGSGEGRGAPALAWRLVATGLASGESLPVPTLQGGGSVLAVTGIASSEAAGALTTLPGAVSVGPSGLSSGETWGTAALHHRLPLAGIGSAALVSAPVLSGGGLMAQPASIGSAEAVGTLVSVPGAITILPSGSGSAHQTGTVVVLRGAVTLLVPGLGTAESLGVALLLPGAITLTGTGLSTGEAFGTARTVSWLHAEAMGPAAQLGALIVQPGPKTIQGTSIASGEGIGTAELRQPIDAVIEFYGAKSRGFVLAATNRNV